MNDNEFALIVGSTKRIVFAAIERHLDARFYYAIDDVAQETYFRAYKALVKDSFRGESAMETWLFAIARNEALRMNKRLGREEEKARRAGLQLDLVKEGGETESEYAQYLDLFDLLPDKYKSVLSLAAEGASEREISSMLNIPAGTVKSRMSRGKEHLIKLVNRRSHE